MSASVRSQPGSPFSLYKASGPSGRSCWSSEPTVEGVTESLSSKSASTDYARERQNRTEREGQRAKRHEEMQSERYTSWNLHGIFLQSDRFYIWSSTRAPQDSTVFVKKESNFPTEHYCCSIR
ncbi:hypothetical protein PoB_001207100 [Plakobranchus ocellatus]|uniref:Uncharacterized protein n=1 Tax=Plakobranchus ocellatus TaxID=259542 RepID=A0AAV3YE30_9GAST|nr:hypothetical protein PoB_001207100 [Plakobranchus ocellatus]